MLKPPFKLATVPLAPAALMAVGGAGHGPCCDAAGAAEAEEQAAAPAPLRARLADLDPQLHCSVIGTCLSTAALRKLMSRFVAMHGSSDLEVHHQAVALTAQGGPVAKALHKALDQQHEAAVQRFARARDEQALGKQWDEALRQGDIPGAYWAILTHRNATLALRQRAFGDVHMLSHLVGAANRADIRRLVALERGNADLRERAERTQLRSHELLAERDRTIVELQQRLADAEVTQSVARATAPRDASSAPAETETLAAVASRIARQTARRERAEQAAAAAVGEATRLQQELAHLRRHTEALTRELAAAEVLLREPGGAACTPDSALRERLRGRRILYVGGRPSSTPAIRELVQRHGGEFRHHDGGLEDRKGLLASGVAWAQWVVFPVDCIDHDSAANLKRLCARHGVVFMPLRSAGVASLAAALADSTADGDARGEPNGQRPPSCLKHG